MPAEQEAGAQPRERSFCSQSCSDPFRSSWCYKHLLGTRGVLWLLGFCLPWQLHGGVRGGREQQLGAGACKSRGWAVLPCSRPLLRSKEMISMPAPLPEEALGVPIAESCPQGSQSLCPRPALHSQLSQGCLQPPQPHVAAGPSNLPPLPVLPSRLSSQEQNSQLLLIQAPTSSQIFLALFGSHWCLSSAHHGGTWQPEVSDRT